MLVAAVLVACGSPDEIGSGPIAQTTFGPVQGRAARDGFVTYHGIPFATPPIGELRWRPPRDPTAWSTPLSALWPGPQCPQLDVLKGHVHGNEDCLRLSVYVPPACTPKSPCAVMQWIYGGAWTVGSEREFGLYDATKLALKYSVVVVAANYRLDALGWLALQELQDESPSEGYSNYGLRDQQLALKWTQRNVGAFGGDPKRVTIFGESAGGFSVCQHLVSPASDRLFSRAIMQSGSCDGPFMILDGDNAKEFGDSYTAALGCPRGRDRLACMRKWSPAEVLVPYIDWLCLWKHADPWCSKHPPMSRLNRTSRGHAAAGRWPSPVPPMAPLAGWTAVVDGVVLPDTPLRMIRQGRLNHGPDGTNVRVSSGCGALSAVGPHPTAARPNLYAGERHRGHQPRRDGPLRGDHAPGRARHPTAVWPPGCRAHDQLPRAVRAAAPRVCMLDPTRLMDHVPLRRSALRPAGTTTIGMPRSRSASSKRTRSRASRPPRTGW